MCGKVLSSIVKAPITVPKDSIIKSACDGVLTVIDSSGSELLFNINDLIGTNKMEYITRKKIEKLFTLSKEMFSAIDHTSTGLIVEHTKDVPTFIIGEKYSLKGVSCDGFEMKEKIYELVGTIDTYGGVEIESVIVKQVSGESGTIFTLSKNDCDSIGIEYQQGLQLFPKSLPWTRVINTVEFDPHNLASTPPSNVDNTVRYVLLKLDGFKDYIDGYVITPSGKIIKEEQFETSIRITTKEPIVYGNGFIVRDGSPLKIQIAKPKNSIFNHGNFISSDNEVFILIELKTESYASQPTFDGYFGVIPKYLDGINPNEFFIIKWDELGAKTIEEYKQEKERLEREQAEAVRREEERIKKEAERKQKETENAIRRMNSFRVNPPTFKPDIDTLANLDLYIDSLDSLFRSIDNEFYMVNHGFSNIQNKLKTVNKHNFYVKNIFDLL